MRDKKASCWTCWSLPCTPRLLHSAGDTRFSAAILRGAEDKPRLGSTLDSLATHHDNRRLVPTPFSAMRGVSRRDRKSTRLNSSHSSISYAVFCLKKKK